MLDFPFVAHDAQFHLRILRPLQPVHSLLVRHLLAHKGFAVDTHNLITSQQSCTLSRTIADDILYMNRILTNRKLDTDT